MPDTQQIIDSIESRLDAARDEVASLEKAIVALTASSGASATATATATAPVAVRPRRAGTRTPRRAAGRAARRELPEGAIEQLLRSAAEGLSAAALIDQTGAAQGKVKAQLRRLELAGEVRSSGARRSSRWHWVSGPADPD